MTEWVAWVEINETPEEEDEGAGAWSRYYVTHGVPFLQLTPFRTQAARYTAETVARRVADLAADASSPRGVEQLPRRLTR
jgi:hypothetical protein